MIFEAEKEAILHLPMEPEGDYDTGPGVITVDMSKQDIFELLEENFASVPLAMGANNHMGSLATADDRVMDIVISFVKEHNKFFIDSKTTPNSVVKKYAELYQVPCLERQVFLDGTNGLDSIRQDINQGMKIAKEYGIAILIGHVQDPSLIEVLKEIYPQLIKQGFELITVSEFLKSED